VLPQSATVRPGNRTHFASVERLSWHDIVIGVVAACHPEHRPGSRTAAMIPLRMSRKGDSECASSLQVRQHGGRHSKSWKTWRLAMVIRA